ncbi:hypothetical protein ASE01_03735 [Nocardioides sp. Root190]|uniref:hypothetical protein n=1 Tax=Nocardioides sp. Root190 TaxID=1736488 RepID=UPI0006FFB873|nr:hypothetical protein [Nocardioides sp. Root190]KRB78396.1 hypothetical protein ASE01_03735 [Nocardioides sp. Root190]
MERWTGRCVTAAVVAVLATGVTACGEDEPEAPSTSEVADLDPTQALVAARAAMLELDDVTYRGRTLVASQAVRLKGVGELIVTSDDRCQSSFTHERQGRLISRAIGETTYVFADAALMRRALRYDPAKVAELKGKWQSTSRMQGRDCDLSELLPDAAEYDSFEDAGTGEVEGVPVRTLTGTTAAGELTVSIATDGEPLVMEVSSDNGESTLTLVEHDSGVRIEAPPAKDVLPAS